MTPSKRIEELVSAFLARGNANPQTQANYIARFRAFAEWAAAHGHDATVPDSQWVLRWMHTAGADWRHNHLKANLAALRWAYARAGAPLEDPRLGQYLSYRRRVEPVRPYLESNVDALTWDALCAMARVLLPPPNPDEVPLVAGLDLAQRAGLAWFGHGGVAFLPREAFDPREDGSVVVTLPDGRPLTLLGDDPLAVDLVGLLDGNPSPPLRPAILPGALRARAGLPTGTLTDAEAVARLGEPDLALLLAVCEPETARRRRRRAALLTGFYNASRHSDLKRADIEDVRALGDTGGFLVSVYHHKTNGLKDPRHAKHLRVEHRPDGCDEVCAACALADHLVFQQLNGRTTGPLFGVPYAGGVKVPTAAGGRYELTQIAQSAGVTLRIGTRSIRSGAAVNAAQNGVSLQEIQELLGHANLETTMAYLQQVTPVTLLIHRRRDPGASADRSA